MILKPTPFLSLCVDGCFEKGEDITKGSATYNFTGVQGVGMADVADSLTALDLFVFKEKKYTMKQLLSVLNQNFEGSEDIRQFLVNKSPKYGDDHEIADKYAKLVSKIYSEEVEKHQNIRGGSFIPGMYSVTAHIPFGYLTGSLPSGRIAGSSLSNGASPTIYSGKKGMTAILNSVSKIDFSLYPNGVNFILTIDPELFAGEKGSDLFSSLMKVYIQNGGMQVNLRKPGRHITKHFDRRGDIKADRLNQKPARRVQKRQRTSVPEDQQELSPVSGR